MNRQQILESIRRDPAVSVLIIGAGVNGIGTFRDLALQGVNVLMVDKGDFCSGASAASSHMIHGGIRYLENGEFRLVRESVRERNRLLKNCPQYVKPLPTTIPIFNWFSGLLNAPLKFLGLLNRPAERGALVIKIGLSLYDAYTRGQDGVPRHDFVSRRESLARYPELNPDIAFTATYYDAAMSSPERICIELMLDAEASGEELPVPVRAINYMPVVGTEGNAVLLRDELTGETLTVNPRIVINAAGPWIDFTNQALGKPTDFIGGTKGSHLVLDHPQLREAIKGHEFFFENEDGRIVLIYPLLDKILVGTSDIPIDNPELARCTEEEVDYFLGMIARVFPRIQVDRSHIIFRFSGVRPLPAADAATAGQISRDHSIKKVEPGNGLDIPVYSLVGGKWTSFRAFAEQTTDEVLQYLGLPRRRSTEHLPIGGGKEYPVAADEQAQWFQIWQERTGLPRPRLETLFERYGTRGAAVATFSAAAEDECLRYQPAYSRREILFLVQQERVVHLDDLFLRRSLLGMLGEMSYDLLLELAAITAQGLDWPAERQEAEIGRSLALMTQEHQVILDK